jgi:hypothetical protein
MTDEREAAQATLDALRARSAAGEPMAIDDAIRRAAADDLEAQYQKRWEPTR